MTPAIGPFFLLRPSHSDLRALERRIPSLPFNFPHVGITTNTREAKIQELKGWSIDRTRAQVGTGRDAYNKAVAALLNWRHFNFDWAFTNAPAIKSNAPVVVIAQSLLLWSMNPVRITAVEKNRNRKVMSNSSPGAAGLQQKQQKCRQTAFAHTTVAGHQISGEERFTVEWNEENDSVWYEVYTISKPATLIATVAQPLLRLYQQLFVVQSIRAMEREVSAANSSS